MEDENDHPTNQPNRLPTIVLRMWIGTTERQRIVEDQNRGLEAEAMFGLVGAVLVVRPSPTHR